MTADLVDAMQLGLVRRSVSTLRLGTVSSVGSSGAVVAFDGEAASGREYPVLSGVRPLAGDRVALARAGSTWLVVGLLNVTPFEAVESLQTGQGTTSATSPTNGSPVAGVAFKAPRSGQVTVSINSDLDAPSGGFMITGWRVRTGSTIGAGAIVASTQQGDPGSRSGNGRFGHGSSTRLLGGAPRTLVSGLTPDADYNAAFYYYVTTGSGTFRTRSILVEEG